MIDAMVLVSVYHYCGLGKTILVGFGIIFLDALLDVILEALRND